MRLTATTVHTFSGLYGELIFGVAAAVSVPVWVGIYALIALLAHGVSTVNRDSVVSLSRVQDPS